MFIEDTVRWRGEFGTYQGWRYQSAPARVWGFDNFGKFDHFSVRQVGSKSWFFVAPDGRTFDTMRDLFADFRLRLCECDRTTDQLEVLRHALLLLKHEVHRTDFSGFVMRAFAGNRAFAEHYIHWLETERLIRCIDTTMADVELSEEGHAILRMLDLTSEGSNADTSPRGALARFDREFPGRRG